MAVAAPTTKKGEIMMHQLANVTSAAIIFLYLYSSLAAAF
jgi:hypothetical protein